MNQDNRTTPDKKVSVKKEIDISKCSVRMISNELMECLVENGCSHAHALREWEVLQASLEA